MFPMVSGQIKFITKVEIGHNPEMILNTIYQNRCEFENTQNPFVRGQTWEGTFY